MNENKQPSTDEVVEDLAKAHAIAKYTDKITTYSKGSVNAIYENCIEDFIAGFGLGFAKTKALQEENKHLKSMHIINTNDLHILQQSNAKLIEALEKVLKSSKWTEKNYNFIYQLLKEHNK